MARFRELHTGEIVPYTTEEETEADATVIESAAQTKITETNNEAIRRITLANPIYDEIFKVQLLKSLWPMLDTASAPADIILVKDIGVYRETKVAEIRAMTTLAEVQAYDPTTDPGWPA
ncbi:MAG: hypothetical protein R3227_02840 [Reinekea sp.]|nr:hypothetical protein [Reinekea sp.]